MASAPDITFRSAASPYGTLSSLDYVQSIIGGGNLPVLQGENSNPIAFRVYNNFAKAAGIASAVNVRITVFDAVDPSGSHTAAKSVTNQEWIRFYETGYGESTAAPALLTYYLGEDTAVGGQADGYTPEYGSAGSTVAQIRAGTDTNGVGFIEFGSYAQLPEVVGMFTYAFAVSVQYEWTP